MARELEVFDAFTARALKLVRDGKNELLADACRLADTAFKAVRGEASSGQGSTIGEEGIQRWLNDIGKAYEELRAEKAVGINGGKDV